METILTDYQTQFIGEPTRWEVLQEINKRNGLEKNEELKKEWVRLEKGFEGEKILLEYLEDYGEKHWKILKNVWLNYYGEFECDVILMTQASIYKFEVKNYTGRFDYKNNQCLYNGKVGGANPIAQAQKATTNLNAILIELPNPPKLQGVLAFVGANNRVRIHDEVSGIRVLPLDELREYIWNIAQEERNYPGYPINTQAILDKIGEYEKNNSFVPEELPGKTAKNIRKGIRCSRCGKYDLITSKSYISCPCGMHESREEAIVRTICEYGVIYNQKNFTTTEVTDFFGGDISYSTVYRYLNKHFVKIGASSSTEYINKRLPFEQIRDLFEFKLPRYLIF